MLIKSTTRLMAKGAIYKRNRHDFRLMPVILRPCNESILTEIGLLWKSNYGIKGSSFLN